jgi:predicted RNA-binding protein
MQTFLPHRNFEKTAKHLDRKRLIKQSVENLQVLKSLAGLYSSGAWKNHPAVKMWSGHEDWLFLYNEAIVKEIIMRGYKNSTMEQFEQIYEENFIMLESDSPWWLGDCMKRIQKNTIFILSLPTIVN